MRPLSFWKKLVGPVEIPWIKNHQGIAAPLQKSCHSREWNLSDELFRASDSKEDRWRLEEALRGTQIFGATGSGKTSGSGRALAEAFLKSQFGGLVLCVKSDEADLWESLCQKQGRTQDLRRITLEGSLKYNFLDAEIKSSETAFILNVSELFMEVISLVNRNGSGSTQDPFWSDSVARMLNHALVLDLAASQKITVSGITSLIHWAVAVSQEKGEKSFLKQKKESTAQAAFRSLVERARQHPSNSLEVTQAIDYFTGEFATLAEKTRSIVVASYTAMADSLLRPPLLNLLCQETTCTPEECFEGKIILVDVPVHVYQRVGKVMNVIWKTAFKRACQRRKNPVRPVFLWCDESQYLVDGMDVKFQTTARSCRCCTVFLTQNIQNYYMELGNPAAVQSLLGSLHNKIYHQNSDPETNEFASKSIGKIPMEVQSISKPQTDFFQWMGTQRKTVSTSTQWDFDVPQRVFTNLKSGGERNRFTVDGILHVPGKKFSNGKTWQKVEFQQRP